MVNCDKCNAPDVFGRSEISNMEFKRGIKQGRVEGAIEVLKSEKVLYLEKIKEIESRFNGMPFDIKESYKKSVKVYQEFIDALDEAIVALELERDWNFGKECNDNLLNENNLLKLKEQKLVEWLEKEIDKGVQGQKYFSKTNDDESGLIWTSRVEILKEILKKVKVGGQK